MLGLREAGEVACGGKDQRAIETIEAHETVILEGIVGPQSRLLGRRVAALGLRRLYGAYIIAIHRHGAPLTGNFGEVRLEMGDTLLLDGPPASRKPRFAYPARKRDGSGKRGSVRVEL